MQSQICLGSFHKFKNKKLHVNKMIKEFLERFKDKKKRFREASEESRVGEMIEERRKTSNERELDRFMEEEREENIKKQLESFRNKQKEKMRKATVLQGPNIFKNQNSILKQPNIFKDNPNIFGGKSMYLK